MTIDEAIKDLDIIRFNPHWDELVKEEYWQVLMEMSMNALEEVQQYRAIGTPGKCRAAMEKQTAKKIKQQQWMYTRCSCGHDFSKHHGDGYYSIPQKQKTKYCPDCGQKLDWSDEE